MESIELSVKMSVPFSIGQKVKTKFYEKFGKNYEFRILEGIIRDIRIEYSLLELKAETWLLVETNYQGRTFTKNAAPKNIVV